MCLELFLVRPPTKDNLSTKDKTAGPKRVLSSEVPLYAVCGLTGLVVELARFQHFHAHKIMCMRSIAFRFVSRYLDHRYYKHRLIYVIDYYVPNGSRASIDIIDFSTSHPSCDFLPKLCTFPALQLVMSRACGNVSNPMVTLR
jgi:hypothetical protein